MLISVENLTKIWKIQPKGVLHVGAHLAEESEDYAQHNWGKTIWIEAQTNLVDQLRKKLDPQFNQVINATVWSEPGITLQFNVSSSSQSSSLLNFGTHKNDYPDIFVTKSYSVTTSTLDEILDSDSEFDFVNLDVQGVELEALKGLGARFDNVKWIYSEVNKKEVYENCSDVKEIDRYLQERGFRRVATRWMKGQGWGDALYIRKEQSLSLISRFRAAMNLSAWIWHQTPSPTNILKRFFHNK
jgi:FkbM family methyltransferase